MKTIGDENHLSEKEKCGVREFRENVKQRVINDEKCAKVMLSDAAIVIVPSEGTSQSSNDYWSNVSSSHNISSNANSSTNFWSNDFSSNVNSSNNILSKILKIFLKLLLDLENNSEG
ncbi:unnamed protein product [Rotaria magnacalcarata]|nr:unnamed protein product [Rotaria magnacalcarata]CAF2179010.1 unnamed protein product [Rotaria magnacalcarata]